MPFVTIFHVLLYSADNSICLDVTPFTCNSINGEDVQECEFKVQTEDGEVVERQKSIYSLGKRVLAYHGLLLFLG